MSAFNIFKNNKFIQRQKKTLTKSGIIEKVTVGDLAPPANGIFGAGFIPKWLQIIAAVFLAVLIILICISGLYQWAYKGKMYQGVEIGKLSLAGKNKEQAHALIQAKIDKLASQGINFYYNDYNFTVKPIVSVGGQTGLAYELWSYNSQEITDELYSLGRCRGNWLENSLEQLRFILFKPALDVDFKINGGGVESILKDNFNGLESPAHDAKLDFLSSGISITSEQEGQVFDYALAMKLLEQDLRLIQNEEAAMILVADYPRVTKDKAEKFAAMAEELLSLAPLKLSFQSPEYYHGRKHFYQTQWFVYRGDLQKWLEIKYSDNVLDSANNFDIGRIYLAVDQGVAMEYLIKIAETINTPAQNAKFEIKDGKVSEWQSSADGFVLNIKKNIDNIEMEFIQNKNNKINLIVSADKSKITNENVNDLGIRELIGSGESDFSGSPINRRHNIANGADILNGILIKPDEKFSLLEALGEIDAEAGYKPELVIKNGRTIPEYGGGLCQIGTTMFRLAINAGLPIKERRNHSYRVSYYEPAGTDATIYNPWPDFKFVNDTQYYLLLQTRIEGNNLIFEFFGTSDGRQVEVIDPVIYNITPPLPAKYIETDELKPGEKKLIEHAHNGADAYFKRNIVWPDDLRREHIEEIWESHYVPWQEVYLIGKTATSTLSY
ncbi:MAG: VanW family protein [Candidatus Kuenenbacteria bacterium]